MLDMDDKVLSRDSFGDVLAPPLPRSYILDTGNLCNLRCPFCQTGKNMPGVERGFMSRETFDTVLAKIGPHAKFISMINWGEPFLNPHINYFFSRCDQLGIRTHVDSNLNTGFWSREQAAAIVESGIGAILGSVDGATQASYSRYRVRGNLAMALHNLRVLREVRDELGRSAPLVGWSFYINRFNQDEVAQARQMAAAIGVPIWFKLLYCEDPTWESRYHRTPDHPDLAMPDWVREIFLDYVPQSLIDNPLHPQLTQVCRQPFSYLVIDWNGATYPCCVVFGNAHRMGSLMTSSLEDLWYGAAYRNSRAFLRNYGPRQDGCSVCETQSCPVRQKSLQA